jgi:CIC family chloride channel protein
LINNEKFFEFAKDLLLPIILGSIIGLAIFLLNNIYGFLNHISLLLISYNPILIFASTLIAFLGGYLIIKLLADNKKCGCGTELVIESYHFRNGFLSLKDTISKTLASVITISFGGSAGLEGPSLLLGGGISSFITRKLGLNQKDLKKLFLCGAAAGFSAIFKAPLTGILLALEIPYKRDIETMVFVPASIASITAYFVSIATFGTETIFPSPMLLPIHTPILIHAVILGVLAALIALIFIKVLEGINIAIERLTKKIPMLYITILGGLILGIIGLFYPEVLGLGYETICKMTTTKLGNMSLIMLISLLIFKIIATSITLNFGGSGGLFIPTLYIGGVLGLIYAQVLNIEPLTSCVMLAMAAMLAAANKTFLTSIALVAETIGPGLIIPTVISAAVGYFITGSISLYKSQLLSKNENQVANESK